MMTQITKLFIVLTFCCLIFEILPVKSQITFSRGWKAGKRDSLSVVDSLCRQLEDDAVLKIKQLMMVS